MHGIIIIGIFSYLCYNNINYLNSPSIAFIIQWRAQGWLFGVASVGLKIQQLRVFILSNKSVLKRVNLFQQSYKENT